MWLYQIFRSSSCIKLWKREKPQRRWWSISKKEEATTALKPSRWVVANKFSSSCHPFNLLNYIVGTSDLCIHPLLDFQISFFWPTCVHGLFLIVMPRNCQTYSPNSTGLPSSPKECGQCSPFLLLSWTLLFPVCHNGLGLLELCWSSPLVSFTLNLSGSLDFLKYSSWQNLNCLRSNSGLHRYKGMTQWFSGKKITHLICLRPRGWFSSTKLVNTECSSLVHHSSC